MQLPRPRPALLSLNALVALAAVAARAQEIPRLQPGGPPAWSPAAVQEAGHEAPDASQALMSGEAWTRFASELARAGEVVQREGAPATELDRAEGYRHLLALLGLGIREVLSEPDPGASYRLRPTSDQILYKWGMDCPDAAYLTAPLRGDARYRVSGRLGTVRYVGFQLMAGTSSIGNLRADALETARDGSFELVLSAERPPGAANWMRLPPEATSLLVRQFLYDWDREEQAQLEIEEIAGAGSRAPTAVTPGRLERQLEALAAFVRANAAFWADAQQSGERNRFRAPVARTDLGGAAENVTVWGAFELGPDEALLIEVEPPPALYWSVSLGNFWWETIDYASRQTSLNGHQARLDADGIFRAVVAQRDPGVPNWLDAADHGTGAMLFRWIGAAQVPLPRTRVVPLAELAAALPADTPHVDAEARRAALERRREAVRRRFGG